MADFDKLVEEYVSFDEKELDLNTFKKLIFELAEAKERGKSVPEVPADEFLKYLPKFELSEKIGQIDNESRQEFSNRVSNLIGVGGAKISEKIKYLNKFFLEEPDENIGISELLQTISFLKILSNAVYDFSPAGAGFIFEALMAALLSGEQVVDQQNGSLPIQDIQLRGGRGVSLKLLNQNGPVKGSIENLINYLGHDKNNRGIDYYVAVKFSDEKIGIYKFTITRDNLLDWIPTSQILKQGKKEEEEPAKPLKEAKQEEMDFTQLLMHLIGSAPEDIGREIKEPEFNAPTDLEKAKKLEKIYKNAYKLDGLSKADLSALSKKFKTTDKQELSDKINNNVKLFITDLEREPTDPLSINKIKWAEDRTSPKRVADVARSRDAKTDQEFNFQEWYRKYMARNPAPEAWQANILQKIKEAGGDIKGKQFSIKQPDIHVIGGKESYLGGIPLGKNINGVLQKYSNKLRGDVTEVFRGLSGLTNSVNKFYLGGDANSARVGSRQAKTLGDLLSKAKITK